MAEAVHRVRNVFEGEDRVSDDIRRIERGLGDLEKKTSGFTDALRGPVGMIASMYLTQEALQRLIEGYHGLAAVMAEEGSPAAQRYVQSTNDLTAAFQNLGRAIIEATGPTIAGAVDGITDTVEATDDLTHSSGGAIATLARLVGEFKLLGRVTPETAAALRDIAPELESIRGARTARGFEPLGPQPSEEDPETRATLQAISRMREEYQSVEGTVSRMSGTIRGELLPSMEMVGIVGVESLELVDLTAQDTEISLQNVAVTVAESMDEVLIPALDRVIDKLFEASGAGDIFGNILKGAIAGFAFGGPLGGIAGAAIGAIDSLGRQGRDDDVPRG